MSRSIFYYILCLISTFSYIPVKSSVSCGDRDLIYTFTWNGRGWTPSGVLGYDCLPRQKKVSRRYHGPIQTLFTSTNPDSFRDLVFKFYIVSLSDDYFWNLVWKLILEFSSIGHSNSNKALQIFIKTKKYGRSVFEHIKSSNSSSFVQLSTMKQTLV